ncbi:hypothetical protein G4V62_10735 [Bacillaceae bacterium SIJ1]|uniref:hypothetical protein n=1 Tax=Litoribacterium kuwaitense TaxID=1398745 RepID=UPI0013EA6453|nr:hypothetical protein [Litoribacterium kuwaitense]NGP45407.1 hypothetical protein [Litoribacterium kuwaitense]
MASYLQKDIAQFVYRRMERVWPEKQSEDYAIAHAHFYKLLQDIKEKLPNEEEQTILQLESEVNAMLSEGERLMYKHGFKDALHLLYR